MKIVTDRQITDAAMALVIEKGYSDMTTKDIAQRAGVHEATLFRRLGSKKEIVLRGLAGQRWLPTLNIAIFEEAAWDLDTDLALFMREYYKRVTPEMVKMSIGLRSPQIYEETASYILMVPQSFVTALQGYFETMQQKSKIQNDDPHTLAMTLFSSTLGFLFLQASFGDGLSPLGQEAYIKATVQTFVEGMR